MTSHDCLYKWQVHDHSSSLDSPPDTSYKVLVKKQANPDESLPFNLFLATDTVQQTQLSRFLQHGFLLPYVMTGKKNHLRVCQV